MKLSQRLKSAASFNPLIMLFYGLIIGAAGYIIIISRAAPPAPTVYLSPSSQTYAINTTFTVDVRENSGTTPVNAVQANFSYPATLVDFVSIDTTTSAFKTDVQATGAAGQVNIARGTAAGGATLTGDQLVATITFKTKTVNGTAAMAFTSGTALVSSTTNTDLLGTLASTAGGSFVIDAAAPTVGLTSPTNGAVLAGGSTTNILATATDNSSVSKVDILVDGVIKTTLTASPYTYSWNTTGLALGAHTIQAKATDPYGNSASTAVINVTLADQTAPTVSISSPLGGSTATGTVSVNVTASDNSGGTGLNKVEFYVDGALKATDTSSPYSFSWDSKTSTDGSHSLTAKAYDNATPANSTTSSAVNVTVDNADHTPPTTPGSFRSTGQTLNTITLAWNASTDNVGVTGYRIQRNGTTVTTVTTLTYTDISLTPATNYSYSIVALDAANNASTVPATLSVATLPIKIGDVNGDGSVNFTDLSMILTNWGTANAQCDLNHNGSVDIYDLSTVLTYYGT